MPQAGLHGLTGMTVNRFAGKREWLLLGIILGTMLPDMDNVAVAVATVAQMDTHGLLHRTFTHSIFFVIAIVVVFYLIGQTRKQPRWSNLGLGLGIGITMHILLDLLGWFNGVYILWPIDYELNFWRNVQPPTWFMAFMNPAEMLMFAVYLYALGAWARKYGTNIDFQPNLFNWMIFEFVLFLLFTPLVYVMDTGFLTIFGALYLFSFFMVFFVTIRMRETVEAAS
ncbi:MAG TPA: metal-dependent hydrolase [Anaerolineales bacterium]|nr:metal-dependent hydrolase [Anaerolineales bacterium]